VFDLFSNKAFPLCGVPVNDLLPSFPLPHGNSIKMQCRSPWPWLFSTERRAILFFVMEWKRSVVAKDHTSATGNGWSSFPDKIFSFQVCVLLRSGLPTTICNVFERLPPVVKVCSDRRVGLPLSLSAAVDGFSSLPFPFGHLALFQVPYRSLPGLFPQCCGETILIRWTANPFFGPNNLVQYRLPMVPSPIHSLFSCIKGPLLFFGECV